MTTKYLSHDELQHIEHANKILKDHLDLVSATTQLSEERIQNFISAYRQYVVEIKDIATALGKAVENIHNSTREMKVITGSSQQITEYCQAIVKLDQLLDEKLIEKLKRIIS